MENLQGGSLTLEHRYDLLELVLEDGPVSHYLAEQDPFARPVWVHVYTLDRAEQDAPALIERLRASAAQLGAVRVDGLLRPIDFGELDALTPFVVTERVALPSLLDALDEQGTLTADQLITLLERLAPGLDALHAAGLVHGAIDPGAIFTPIGDLSRAALGMPGVALSVADLELLGAPPSAAQAPELQLDPIQASDPSADMWAIGRLLYMCLVGVDPADEGELQPLEVMGVDAAIAHVIACAMDPMPEARWQSCAELVEALREASAPAHAATLRADEPAPAAAERPVRRVRTVAEQPPEEQPALPNRLGTFAVIAGLAFLVSNLGWLTWVLSTPGHEDRTGGGHQVLPTGVQIATEPPGAEVVLTGPEARPLGQTPLLVPAPNTNETKTIKLTAPGHRPATLTLSGQGSSQEVLIVLDRLD